MSVSAIDDPKDTACEPTRRVTGFAIADYAARAGRKGQAMGLSRRWTADEARGYAAAAGRASVAKRAPDDQRLVHARAEAQRKREMGL